MIVSSVSDHIVLIHTYVASLLCMYESMGPGHPGSSKRASEFFPHLSQSSTALISDYMDSDNILPCIWEHNFRQ